MTKLSTQQQREIMTKVYEYDTKHTQGFIKSEIEELLKLYPEINMDKFNNALGGNTCMRIDNEIITYHCDIYKAVLCGLENRNLSLSEWD